MAPRNTCSGGENVSQDLSNNGQPGSIAMHRTVHCSAAQLSLGPWVHEFHGFSARPGQAASAHLSTAIHMDHGALPGAHAMPCHCVIMQASGRMHPQHLWWPAQWQAQCQGLGA